MFDVYIGSRARAYREERGKLDAQREHQVEAQREREADLARITSEHPWVRVTEAEGVALAEVDRRLLLASGANQLFVVKLAKSIDSDPSRGLEEFIRLVYQATNSGESVTVPLGAALANRVVRVASELDGEAARQMFANLVAAALEGKSNQADVVFAIRELELLTPTMALVLLAAAQGRCIRGPTSDDVWRALKDLEALQLGAELTDEATISYHFDTNVLRHDWKAGEPLLLFGLKWVNLADVGARNVLNLTTTDPKGNIVLCSTRVVRLSPRGRRLVTVLRLQDEAYADAAVFPADYVAVDDVIHHAHVKYLKPIGISAPRIEAEPPDWLREEWREGSIKAGPPDSW